MTDHECEAAKLLALASVLSIPRPYGRLPIQVVRITGFEDRWAVADGMHGRRRHRVRGWVYEATGLRDEKLRDGTRYTLAEAVALARDLAERGE